jgi:hypothetical protein
LINLLPNGTLCIIDGLTAADETNLTLNVCARGLRNVNLASGLGLHLLDGFTTLFKR